MDDCWIRTASDLPLEETLKGFWLVHCGHSIMARSLTVLTSVYYHRLVHSCPRLHIESAHAQLQMIAKPDQVVLGCSVVKATNYIPAVHIVHCSTASGK